MTPTDLTPMTERHHQAVRAMLVDEATRPDPVLHGHRGWMAAAVGTVAVTAAAVLLTQGAGTTPVDPATPPPATAPASVVVVTAPIPQPGSGQFLYSTTTTTSGSGTQCGADLAGVQFVNTVTVQRWDAPGVDGARHLVATYGTPRYRSAADATLADASCPTALDLEKEYVASQNTDVRGHGGTWDDGSTHSGSGPFQRPTPDFLAGLSRDPAALLQQLTADNDSRGSAAQTLTNATDLLGNGVALPLDLRAAAAEALTGIPGATVTDAGTRVTITITEASTGDPSSATLDKSTGLITGQMFFGSTYTDTTQYGVTDSDTAIPTTLS